MLTGQEKERRETGEGRTDANNRKCKCESREEKGMTAQGSKRRV
jgi:hypothetical protein